MASITETDNLMTWEVRLGNGTIIRGEEVR